MPERAPLVRNAPLQGLRDRTTTGFVWFILQSVGSKGATLLGQVALAWLLVPEDFGLVGLAYTITSFSALLQQLGIREVLIRRGRGFVLWSGPGFALSVAAGVLGGLVSLAAAPLAAWIYEDPRLIGLIAVLAVASPLWSAAIVPRTRLEVELRFGAVASVSFGVAIATVVCSVALAAFGAGAYSFVLPRLIVGVAQLAVLLRIAPIRLRGAMRLKRWRLLAGDSVYVFLSHVLSNLYAQGDYFLLGLTVTKTTVGLYYFAFSLSMQTAVLFSQNLARVLLPAIAVLQRHPDRQNKVAIEAFELLAFMTTPVCLLQAVLAGPGIRLFFADRWEESIPLVQLLSVAMAMAISAWPVSNLFDAQGRFRARMWFSAGSSAVFFAIATPAVFMHGAEGAAIAVLIHRLLFMPAQLIVAMKGFGAGLRVCWRVNGRTLLAGGLAAVAAVWLNASMPDGTAWDGVRLVTGTVTLALLYAAAAWMLMPECYRSMGERIGALRRSMARARGSAQSAG